MYIFIYAKLFEEMHLQTLYYFINNIWILLKLKLFSYWTDKYVQRLQNDIKN